MELGPKLLVWTIHLTAIGVVVAEAIAGIPCPLTVWEQRLRKTAGQSAYPGDFLGYWAHRLIFFQAEPWVFTLAYTLFGIAVLATFFLVPPRRSRPARGHSRWRRRNSIKLDPTRTIRGDVLEFHEPLDGQQHPDQAGHAPAIQR